MASAQDIVSEVLARDEWAKLRSFSVAATESRKKIEEWRAKSSFWREWTIVTDISAIDDKSISEDTLRAELKKAGELEMLVDALNNDIMDLLDHQKIEKRRNT